jgi:hypothetical protein
MNYRFGSAKQLYDQHIHPRLFCTDADLALLRQQVRTGNGRKLMDVLRDKVRPLIQIVEDTSDLPSSIAHNTVRKDGRAVAAVEALMEIALVSVLDDDRGGIEAVRRILAAVPEAEAKGPRDRLSLGYSSLGQFQFAYDLVHARMTAQEREAYTRWVVEISIRETLKTLRKGHYLRCAGANIPEVGMMTAMLSLLAVEGDPGVPDLSAEKAELLLFFEGTLFSMMGRNGYPHEDIAYGSGMGSLMARVVEALRRAGIYDTYTQCPRYLKFGRAMLAFVQPWGKFLSNTGDYGADFGWRSPIFPRLATETRDPALLWLHGTISYPVACAGPLEMSKRRISFPELYLAPGFQVPVDAFTLLTLDDLRRPVHPSRTRIPTQYMDPDRGIVSFRSSWQKDATFVVFDGSQRCTSAQGHAHDSGGHFSLSALGEYFAIDTGRYNIEQDQHNVVLVDGKSGQSTGGEWRMSYYAARLTDYRPGEFVDTATVDNSQMANCYWSRRTLGLVKGDDAPAYVWTVEDVNKANDYREFWWCMNVHPDHKIVLARDHATVVGSDHGNCLDVFFALPDPKAYPKPHRLKLSQNLQLAGSHKYMWDKPKKLARLYRQRVGHLEYGPVFARPRLVAKVAGYNGRFLSLMIPRRKGGKLARVERLASVDNSLAVRITFSKVEDTLIWAYEHNILQAGGVDARGQWCVVRRSRGTGRVIAYETGPATSLMVDGVNLRLR